MSSKGKPLNFNIRNYTITDLQDIFELPNQYDSNVIEIKETKLREKLLSNPKLTPKLKQDTVQFLNSAKIKLQENIKSTKQSVNEHPLIIKNSAIDDKSKGIVSKRLIKKHVNIDTRFRDNMKQLTSNFDIEFSFKLTNVIKMELSSIEFPTTFYAISKLFGNNFYTINIVLKTSQKYTALFQLTDGNYSKTTIINALNSVNSYIYDNIAYGFDDTNPNIFNYINFDVDIDNEGSGTGRTEFSMDASLNTFYDVSYVELLFNENMDGCPDSTHITKKIGWMLGFREESYQIMPDANNEFKITSESLIDITGPKYLFLAINDYNSNNDPKSYFYSGFNSVILNKNILARIPLTTFSFSFEVANMLNIVSTPREYDTPITIDKINIQVIDEYGRVVDLNNMNISFCLTFTSSYNV